MQKRLLFLLFFPFAAFAQIPTIGGPAPEIEWLRVLGGTARDASIEWRNTNSTKTSKRVTQIYPTPDGGSIFGTNTASRDGDLTNLPNSMPPIPDLEAQGWIVKLNKHGGIAWQLVTPYFLINEMTPTPDGNYLFCGRVRDTLLSTMTNVYVKAALFKVSPTGTLIWHKIYTDEGRGLSFCSITPTPDGGYALTASQAENMDAPETCLDSPNRNPFTSRMKIYKIDANGNIQWDKCYGSDKSEEYPHTIKALPNGDMIFVAGIGSPGRDVPVPMLYNGPPYTPAYDSGVNTRNVWLVKINAIGTILWSHTIGDIPNGDGHLSGAGVGNFDIDITNDGVYLTGGTTIKNLIFANRPDYSGLQGYEKDGGFLLKFDFNGSLLWSKMLGGRYYIPQILGSGGHFGLSQIGIRTTADGGCITTGSNSYINGDGEGSEYKSLSIFKWTSNGDLEWKKFIGGTKPMSNNRQYFMPFDGKSVVPTADNGYIVIGDGFLQDWGEVCGAYINGQQHEDIVVIKLKTLPAPIQIQGDTILVCTQNTTLTADQPTPQPTPPASYLWSTGATTQSISNVGAGTYFVTITYENRCTKSTSVTVQAGTINIPPANVSITPAGCNGQGGSAMLNATGGSAPYLYTCASGSINANTITGLNTGTYVVTITDANGCTGTTSINIPTQNSTLNITSSTTPSGCTPTGSATLTVQNGTPPYAYTLTGTPTLTGTSATAVFPPLGGLEGGYVMFITDANGCTGSTTITISQAANDLSAIATATQIPCAGGTGSISVSVTNGIAPYTVNYTSTNGSNGSTTTTSNTVSLPSFGGVGGGFGSGDYSVLVRDVSGCTTTATATINAAPLPLTANISVQNATCGLPNGSLTANINGGTAPYTVVWTGSNGTNGTTISTSNTVSLPSFGGVGGGFPVGVYAVTITDANLCSVIAPTATITSNPPITASITTTPTKCYGEPSGSIAISNVQNAIDPVLYSLDNQPFVGGVLEPYLITNVLGGAHTVTVEDATGCKLTATANVAEGPRFTVNIGRDTVLNFGDSLLMIANTTSGFPVSPVTYSWTCNAAANINIGNRSAIVTPSNSPLWGAGGACTLLVTDGNGCTATDALLIKLKDANGIFIPNIFTPNGDGANDEFVIFAGSMVESVVLLQIFDRWGALIHQKTDFAPNTPAWDGTVPVGSGAVGSNTVGSEQRVFPSSVYVYRTEIRLRSGELKTLTGDVTLLR